MGKVFLRSTGELSILKKESENSIKIISSSLGSYIMENRDFSNRCISMVPKGKNELRKMLEDARKIVFTKKDLINWFHKIKEDAVNETDLIFINYDSSIGADVNKIDFERAGFLAGLYQEAERYLDLIIAIEPLDKNKAHYSVIDRLERLDEEYINKDNIPGFYAVQTSLKVYKHKYEINNLDDYWKEYLSLQDKYEVTEGFGDFKYLLAQFHSEFKWKLVKVRPREDIKEFLDYHLKKYEGEPIDFLNHIEFRIMPEIDEYAGNDYPIYQLIIKEWLREKRSILRQKEQNFLFESVVEVASTFLDNVFEYKKSSDENKYNLIIRDFLIHSIRHKGWSVKDQSMGGTTDSVSQANSAGISSRDLIVINEKGHHVSAMECFRLKSVPIDSDGDSDIKSHLKKIFRNEPIGISPLFIIGYCETKSFSKTWTKYLDYISKIDFENYQSIECTREIDTLPMMANLKVAKVKHIRETNVIEIFHLFINMNP